MVMNVCSNTILAPTYRILQYAVIMLIGYLLGCSSMSFYISKWKNINIKEKGSKNYGASNTLALVGKRAGLAVLLHDIFKATLAIILIRFFLHIPYNNVEWVLAAIGLFAVIGHIFPFYLKFQGGKGFASYLGVVLGLDWRLFLGVVVLLLVAAFVTDYIVAGTFTAIIATPLYFLIIQHRVEITLIMTVCSLLLLYKHRENVVNIIEGKEMKIRSAFQKKYQQKDGKEA